MLWEMVRSQLGRHKLRTVLTILSILIGIFLLTSMVSFSEGIQVTLDEYVGSFAGLVTVMDGDVSGYDIQAMMSSELDDSLIEEIEALGDVEQAEGMAYTITDAGQVAGMDADGLSMFGFDIGFQEGEMFEAGTDNQIVLGATYAKRRHYAIGDEVRIKEKNYEVVGILESLGSSQDDNSIWMPLKETQKLSGSEDKVMCIMVKAANMEDTENLAIQIMDEFDDVTAITDKEMIRQIDEMLGQINIMIYAIGLIASIIAGIVIMNVMFMSVNERTTEIGALKALGATDKQVLSEILVEAISMSLIGGAIGVLLSFVMATALNSYLDTRVAEVTLRLAASALLYSAFLGAVGGLIPARRAAKLSPVVALRYE